MKDDIHNTVLVDSSNDKAVLLSLGDIQKALSQDKKGVKVHKSLLWYCCTYTSSLQIIFVNKQVICPARDKFSPDKQPVGLDKTMFSIGSYTKWAVGYVAIHGTK